MPRMIILYLYVGLGTPVTTTWESYTSSRNRLWTGSDLPLKKRHTPLSFAAKTVAPSLARSCTETRIDKQWGGSQGLQIGVRPRLGFGSGNLGFLTAASGLPTTSDLLMMVTLRPLCVLPTCAV